MITYCVSCRALITELTSNAEPFCTDCQEELKKMDLSAPHFSPNTKFTPDA